MNIAELHALISAVCPIEGVDSEGGISFRADASPSQKAAALAIVEANLPDLGAASFAELKSVEIARWKAIRDPYFARLASIETRLSAAGDAAGAASAVAVANSLLGLFTDSTVTTATTFPAFTSALKIRYAQAVALATPSAAAEFGKYDK